MLATLPYRRGQWSRRKHERFVRTILIVREHRHFPRPRLPPPRLASCPRPPFLLPVDLLPTSASGSAVSSSPVVGGGGASGSMAYPTMSSNDSAWMSVEMASRSCKATHPQRNATIMRLQHG